MQNNLNNFMINIDNISHEYDNKCVLKDVNLNVKAGEFLTVVGSSGCGKSTLIRLILGAEKSTKGKIYINNQEKIKPDRDCNIVYQKYSIFPHLTVLENVTFGLTLDKSNPMARALHTLKNKHWHKEYIDQAREMLCKVDMGGKDIENKYPYQLSGGMQQRVAIAQSLIMHPKVLLFDEPFSALDLWVRKQLQTYIADLWQDKRMTFIFITHDIKEAIVLGTRLIVLSPYWQDSYGKNGGSKIVMDIPVPSYFDFQNMDKTQSLKTQDEITSRIQALGFDRGKSILEKDFIMEHENSIKN